MKAKHKGITIRSVAQAAGVSVSTVSRVLNGKDDVALETVEKVKKLIHEMNYASSLAARGMRSHRTNVIGVVLADVESPYTFEILRGINRVIAQSEFHLLVYTSGSAPKFRSENQESQYVMLLNSGITDGVILVTPSTGNFNHPSPLVIIDPFKDEPDTHTIYATNYEGAQAAVNYLIGLGHRRIAHITGSLSLLSGMQRLKGFRDALSAQSIPLDDCLVKEGDFTMELAKECALCLLRLPNPPTAIFAASDMTAMGVYQAAEMLGLRIPQDVSVIGFDNVRESVYMNPPLTTINQPIFEMGELATRLMVDLLHGETPAEKQHVFPTELIVRASCCPLD